MPLKLQHPVFDSDASAYTARHAVTKTLLMISRALWQDRDTAAAAMGSQTEA